MFLLGCGFNAGNIMYDREHMFWESMREMLSDLEDQLLPTGTVIPADKTLSDLYRDKIGKILKKLKNSITDKVNMEVQVDYSISASIRLRFHYAFIVKHNREKLRGSW